MFEIHVKNARFWRNCVEAIMSLIDEGVFFVKEDGISLSAMDPSQIAMVSFYAPKSAFENYAIDGPMRIGVSIENLGKILARARDTERLVMKADGNKLTLEFFEGNSKRSFTLPLLDVAEELRREPKFEHDASVTIKGSALKKILGDAIVVSSHIMLSVTEKALVVDAGGDNADFRVETEKGSESVPEIKARASAKATFPLQYLNDMVKACPDNELAVLHLSTNKPLKVEYGMDGARLVYYLAPRIEQE
ncbi:MAG: proliferating cell nuclear antigen (pcna) [Candidatus Micrarchaeia archaeon]